MKRIIIGLFFLLPFLMVAQGHKGNVAECAPMKDGKVCYRDTVQVHDMKQLEVFKLINAWAKKNYGKDVFMSNVNAYQSKGIVSLTSKVELLLNDTDKTIIKYKMQIFCHDNSYTAEVSKISYQYDPNNEKKYKNYPAESIIANNGKGNTVAIVKDPKLFCNATFFFVEDLFDDLLSAVNKE